jgi:hypothetical protein
MSKLEIQPITYREACRFIAEHHRHHKPPQGYLFGLAINDGETVVGVATVGRPVARMFQNGYTAEVTRLCVMEGHKNGCSMLYAACWRAARSMGYRRLITYILSTESGVSLKASGWKEIGKTEGGSWDRPSRPRVDKSPTIQKILWEAA